ncbi:MAG: hypothetical protein QOH67_4045 [Hyphomicrobiales bacterium]|nr:hypothetical protein [Hyphomicrobiales bacterium]
MSGDYSRLTFDPAKHYTSVRMQQGRVLTDSDWNEQGDLLDRRARAAIVDMFGRFVLATPEAFAITSDSGLSIGRGRLYLDGLLAENRGAGVPAWDPVLMEEYGSAPVPYAQQPFLPNPPALPVSGGPYLVYLDVWEREVTAAEDPGLADAALGGPDTATRTQTIWQVKVLTDAAASRSAPLEKSAQFAPSGARLSTRTGPAGYQGQENHLYRVEIHEGGAPGQGTFKWSRDNGSVVARVLRQNNPSQLTVESDKAQRFAAGDWVEVIDDPSELHGIPGEMRKVTTSEGDVVNLAPALKRSLGANPRIRRWDQKGKVLDERGNLYADLNAAGATGAIAIPPRGRSVVLEDGVIVGFDLASVKSVFKTGDYWVTPARPADRSIAPLKDAPPRGIHHHYAELALYKPPKTITDRRKRRT